GPGQPDAKNDFATACLTAFRSDDGKQPKKGEGNDNKETPVSHAPFLLHFPLSLSLSLSLCISMADFDAPSFFLGLDFDADLPQSAPQSPTHATTSRHSPSYNDGNDAVLVKTLVPDPLFPFLKRDLFLPPPSALGSRWELPRDVGDSPKEMPSREDPQRGEDSGFGIEPSNRLELSEWMLASVG
ncbi:hypothetical protein ACLOJK_029693, partial [Asimina triloba]